MRVTGRDAPAGSARVMGGCPDGWKAGSTPHTDFASRQPEDYSLRGIDNMGEAMRVKEGSDYQDIRVPPGFMVLSPDWGDNDHQALVSEGKLSVRLVVTFRCHVQWADVVAKLPGLTAGRLRRMAPLHQQQLVMPEPTRSWQQGYEEKLSDMHRANISTGLTAYHAGMSEGDKAARGENISTGMTEHHAGMSAEDKAVSRANISTGVTEHHAGMSEKAKTARGNKISATKLAKRPPGWLPMTSTERSAKCKAKKAAKKKGRQQVEGVFGHGQGHDERAHAQ